MYMYMYIYVYIYTREAECAATGYVRGHSIDGSFRNLHRYVYIPLPALSLQTHTHRPTESLNPPSCAREAE